MPSSSPSPRAHDAGTPRAHEAGQRLVAAAMVGRARELGALREALADPASSAVISVEGEAGVGKTRLVSEMLQLPELAGSRILVGRCHPIHESFPLGPVIEALREAGQWLVAAEAGESLEATDRPDGGHDGSDGRDGSDAHERGRERGRERRRALGGVAGALRPMLPELAQWLPPAPEPLDDRVGERHRVFRGLVEVLQALAPVVLVLEDVHWADTQSIDFVSYLLADPPGGVSLVLTYRAEDADARVRALTARVPRGTSRARLSLAPLGVQDTGELTAAILGVPRVSEDFTSYLWERTSGLPFAVEEILALVREQGRVVHVGDQWARKTLDQLEVPHSIRDTTLERVARVSSSTQQVVEALAVLRTATAPEVVAVMLAANEVAADLEEGIAHGLFAETDAGFGFRHALAAQAVYEALSSPRRRALHAAAAAALRAQAAVPLGQVAHHLRHAGRIEQWAEAARVAADQAVALGHEAEAVRILGDVIAPAQLSPELSPARRGELAVALGWAAIEARTHPQEVTELMTGALDGDLPAPVRGELRLILAIMQGQIDAAEAETRRHELYRAAIPDLGHRPDLQAWAMVGLGSSTSVPMAERMPWLMRAVEVVEGVDDPLQQVFVIGKAASTLMERGDASWRDMAERIEQITGAAPQRRREVNAHYVVGISATYLGHLRLAERLLRQARNGEAVRQNRQLATMIRAGIAVQRFQSGDWDGLADEVADLLADAGIYVPSQMDVGLVAGGLALASGDVDRAAVLLRQVIEFTGGAAIEVVPAAAGQWIRAALAQGDITAALEGARTVTAIVAEQEVWPQVGWALPRAVEALTVAGHRGEAEAFTEQTAQALQNLDAPAGHAAVRHASGLLANDADELLAAADAYEALPARYEAALARERAAELLLQAGDERGAVPLQEVLATYLRLGATRDSDRAAGLARRHGLALPAPHRGGRRGYGPALSPRERQVAELAATGHTNGEIARELFVSTNTVAKQLAAAMRKLHAGSRRELRHHLPVLADDDAVSQTKNGLL